MIIQFVEWLVSLLIGWFGGRRAKDRAIRVENRPLCLGIYHAFGRLFDLIQFEAKVEQKDLLRFKREAHAAGWLFGPEISAYADDVFNHGRRFWLTREQLKEMGISSDERTKIAEAQNTEWGWFFAQYKVLDEKFMPYLNLND